MDIGAVAIRALFAYAFLLVLLRISGKRTVAEGTALDFVVALILGDLIDDLLLSEVPASQFVVACGVVVLAHVLTSLAVFHSPAAERLVQGTPTALVRDGALAAAAMGRERMNRRTVTGDLRAFGVEDLREVEAARLEVSGRMSVLPRPWAKEAQMQDAERVEEARAKSDDGSGGGGQEQ